MKKETSYKLLFQLPVIVSYIVAKKVSVGIYISDFFGASFSDEEIQFVIVTCTDFGQCLHRRVTACNCQSHLSHHRYVWIVYSLQKRRAHLLG